MLENMNPEALEMFAIIGICAVVWGVVMSVAFIAYTASQQLRRRVHRNCEPKRS